MGSVITYVLDSVSFVMFVCLSLYSLLPDVWWIKLFITYHVRWWWWWRQSLSVVYIDTVSSCQFNASARQIINCNFAVALAQLYISSQALCNNYSSVVQRRAHAQLSQHALLPPLPQNSRPLAPSLPSLTPTMSSLAASVRGAPGSKWRKWKLATKNEKQTPQATAMHYSNE